MTASSQHGRRISENPRIRKERGKYGARSCLQCRRRKVKCTGGFPCSRCISQKHECDSPISEQARKPNDPTSSTVGASRDEASQASVELLQRLSQLSGSMSALVHDAKNVLLANPNTLHPTVGQEADHGPVFAPGELSQIRDQSQVRSFEVDPSENATASGADQSRLSWLEQRFQVCGVVPDQHHWRCYLRTYFTEMHILCPFLHPPAVWESFERFWSGDDPSFIDSSGQNQGRTSLAIVFLCMAIGRCTISPRSRHTEDRHSSGWSFHNISTALLSDLLDLAKMPKKPSLVEVQALLLLTLYFFRLNINDRAQSLLAQTSMRANILGINRPQTLDTMSMFQAEMSIRTCCCLYMLDRFVSLETGLSYIVPGKNSGLRDPYALSDEFLETYRNDYRSSRQMMSEINYELARSPATSIPWMIGCNAISRLIGEIWDYHDGAWSGQRSAAARPSGPDWQTRLNDDVRMIDTSLLYQVGVPFENQFEGMEWWQKKQALDLYMRLNNLRYLIHRSDPVSIRTIHDKPNDLSKICSQLAAGIVDAYNGIPTDYPKTIAPFVWHLSSATIMLLSIVSQRRDLRQVYRSTILSALESLRICAASTWISGSVIRTLARLNTIAKELGLFNDSPEETGLDSTPNDSLAGSPALVRSSTGLMNEDLFYKAFKVQQPGNHGSEKQPATNSAGSSVCISSRLPGGNPSEPHQLVRSKNIQYISDQGQQNGIPQEIEDTSYTQTSNLESMAWLPTFPESLIFDPSEWILEDFMI